MKEESGKQHFIRVIDHHRGIIHSLCKAYYNSYEDQQDAYQDIILQLWKSFDTFKGASEWSTWIYKVSLHTLLNKVRSERNKVITDPLLKADDVAPMVMADDEQELLRIIIQSLKDVDKAIVILYLEGYKNKEIAHMLDITSTNVSTRLNRLKTELKLKFKKNEHEFKST
jgi:RNA polymerase sigma-70 factor (ECF subfamily)